MILVGLDDTDTLDSRGTNQLAKVLARQVADEFRCRLIVRHQLLDDPRVPYTSQNGSASMWFEPLAAAGPDELWVRLRSGMLDDFVPGSDPGLAMFAADAEQTPSVFQDTGCLGPIPVPTEIVDFGKRCRTHLVTRSDAHAVAERSGVWLEGLGGTRDGVIGSVAAIGLASTGDDGRIVHSANWHDAPGGLRSIESLAGLDVEVRDGDSQASITAGTIDLGRKLRPNLRGGRAVLFARPAGSNHYVALKRK